MGWFNNITLAIMLGIFAFGMIEATSTIGFDNLKNRTAEDPAKIIGAVVGYNQGLNAITPALRFNISEKIPVIGGKNTFLINDIPLPDGTDMIILVPVIILWFAVLKYLKNLPSINIFVWLIIAIFGTIFVAILTWVLIKLFWYGIFLVSAKILGMTIGQAKVMRESVIMQLRETVYIMMLFGFFSVVAMARIMWGAIKGQNA